MNREKLKGFAISGALAAAAWFGAMHVSAMAPAPRAHAEETVFAGPEAAAPQDRSDSRYDGAGEDWSLLREGFSDGRYWAWIDQQIAMP